MKPEELGALDETALQAALAQARGDAEAEMAAGRPAPPLSAAAAGWLSRATKICAGRVASHGLEQALVDALLAAFVVGVEYERARHRQVM